MDDKEKQLQNFFNEIQEISEKCKRKEPFNAFLSFGVNRQEVMHSKFIAMLLNPKGAHKHADKFLKLFLNQLQMDGFDYNGATVKCEKGANGRRRIDIAIETTNQIIIIENKIWASDQSRQIVDYYNFATTKKVDENVFMIYLTPYGHSPSEDSLGNGELPVDKVLCISYEKHILGWLEKCTSDLHDERLKLSLEMYEELIRTVINRDKFMTEIMNNLMSNPENMELAIDIVKSFQGRDFLKESQKLEDFEKQIIEAAETCGIYNPYSDISSGYLREIDLQNDDNSIYATLGSICLDNTEIFVVNSKGIPSLPELTINTCNINDPNLQNLLTHNFEGVYEWMEQVINKLRYL
jgi:hypothetical protein